MAEALDNPFAQQPSNLESPVPTENTLDNLKGMFADAPQGQIQLDQQAPAQEEPDTLSQIGQMFQSQAEVAPADGSVGELPEAITAAQEVAGPEGIDSIREQFRESSARLKHSFGVGGKVTAAAIKEAETMFGNKIFDDVRVAKDEQIQVKRKGDKEWTKLDRKGYQLLSDTIDMSRTAFEIGIETAYKSLGGITGAGIGGGLGALAGAGAGLAAGAPTGPGAAATGTAGFVTGGGLGAIVGGALGMAKGGAAGAPVALMAGDFIEEQLGVKRDPRRSFQAEAAIASAAGAMFDTLGSRAARKSTIKRFKQEEAGKFYESATARVNEVTKEVENVRSAGIKLDPKGGKFKFDAAQSVDGKIPDIAVTAKKLADEPAYINFVREQGDMLKGAYDSIFSLVNAKLGRPDAGKEFVLTTHDILRHEGQEIRRYRNLLDEKLAGEARPAPVFMDAVKNAFSEIGGKVQASSKGVSFKIPDEESILKEFPAFTPAQARSYRSELQEAISLMQKGGGNLTADQSDKLYTKLVRKINGSINTSAGRPYAMKLIELKDAIRDDWSGMIEAALPDNQKGDYLKTMGNYSEFKVAVKNLQSVIGTEHITRDALVKKLFEGNTSLKFARNAKVVMNTSDPDLWRETTLDYFRKLRADNLDGTQLDWHNMSKKWSKLPTEMKKELLDGSGIPEKGFNSLISIGRIYSDRSFAGLPAKTKSRLAKEIAMTAVSGVGTTAKVSAVHDAIADMAAGIGKDEALMMWFKEGGAEQLIKEVPALKNNLKKQTLLRKFVNNWVPKTGLKSLGYKAGSTPVRRSLQEGLVEPGPEEQ